jgi:RNA polymerase subunit RPABC4/transcription elongation factor Spt4
MSAAKSNFKGELSIISPVAVVLSTLAFICVQVLFTVLPKGPHDLPPYPWWAVLSFVAGLAMAAWVLLIGYINQDSKRRGMGQLLWTLLAIFVPNCLGILLYFLLRKPMLKPCPGCGWVVQPDFRFCAKCGVAMAPTCAHCGRSVSHDFVCCPYCGKTIGAPVS